VATTRQNFPASLMGVTLSRAERKALSASISIWLT
jgi:hypothetical protein